MTDLARYAADHGLRHFLFSFSDLFGVQRAKLVPASAVNQVARDGAGFAGFAAWLAMTPADPDVLGLPDPASLAVLPWQRSVAWLATDLQVEGRPLEQSPRWVLRRQLERVDRLGYSFRTGVEAEFFLLEPGGKAIADGHDTQNKPCYDQLALMRQFELIGGLLEAMEELGWGPYQADHEDANGQFEINWTFADALVTADRHAFFRVMAQSMAEPLGARVSFGPKPFPQLTGSGAHLHHSLWDSSGRNLFHDPRGELGLSQLAYHFLGGLLEHAPALCAITNPTAESYARLGGSPPTPAPPGRRAGSAMAATTAATWCASPTTSGWSCAWPTVPPTPTCCRQPCSPPASTGSSGSSTRARATTPTSTPIRRHPVRRRRCPQASRRPSAPSPPTRCCGRPWVNPFARPTKASGGGTTRNSPMAVLQGLCHHNAVVVQAVRWCERPIPLPCC